MLAVKITKMNCEFHGHAIKTTSLSTLLLSVQELQFLFTMSWYIFIKTNKSKLHLHSILQFKNSPHVHCYLISQECWKVSWMGNSLQFSLRKAQVRNVTNPKVTQTAACGFRIELIYRLPNTIWFSLEFHFIRFSKVHV